MKQLLAVLVLLLAVKPLAAGEWYPVVIHVHTVFSDGGGTPDEVAATISAALAKARYDGKCAIIVCDHFDGVARNFDAYAATIRKASGGKVILIPGLELGSKWRPEPNTEAVSHLLAIGNLPASYRTLLECYDLRTSGNGLPLLDRFDMQQRLIEKVLTLGMLPIAAHPTQLVVGGTLARSDNRFDSTGNHKGLLGFEMFNTLGPGQDQKCVELYLAEIKAGQSMILTAGSDYHGTTLALPDRIVGSLKRVTWVFADEFSEAGILKAVAEGKTYAADDDARFGNFLSDFGQNPGSAVVGVDKVTIAAQAWLTGTDIWIIVYRDGEEVVRQHYDGSPNQRRVYSLNGGDSLNTGWVDSNAQVGETHSYVVRVTASTKPVSQTILITSPIVLRLREPGLTDSFFDAIKSGNLPAIEAGLTTDPSLANSRDQRENYNFTVHISRPLALSVACALGNAATVDYLLGHGASPDGYLTAGEPGPLMEVAISGDVEKASLLLKHGANINICTDGNTPLAWALGGKKVELAKFLLDHGADPNSRSDNGDYALAIARRQGLTEIVRILEAKGAKE